MKHLNHALKFVTNIQILSAIIWAISIIACSWVNDKNHIPTILTTAGGFHVILLAHFNRNKPTKKMAD